MSDEVVRHRRGHVLVARLNRPEARNALNRAVMQALGYAERIAANDPLAVVAAKELVRLGVTDADRAAERLRELQPRVFASEDAKEGALAFVERREPVWKGR